MEKNQKQPTDPRFSAGIPGQDADAGIRRSSVLSDEAMDAVTGGDSYPVERPDDDRFPISSGAKEKFPRR